MPAPRRSSSPIGRQRAHDLAGRFGRELRIARAAVGLTQSQVGRLAGCSQQQVSRAERGRVDVSLVTRCRLVGACGFELGWRLYPFRTVRLRDSGQLGIATAIGSTAPPGIRVALEVPVAPGDLRAADLVITLADEIVHVEIERSLVDLQAQLRAAQLKRQALAEHHDRPVRLVLAVPDTAATRRAISDIGPLLERALPATSRTIWSSIRTGRPIGADGLLFVRPATLRARALEPRAKQVDRSLRAHPS